MAKKLKLKTKAGKLVSYPTKAVKRTLGDVGYTGKLLVSATGNVFKEAKKLAKGGIITATNLEKAVVKGVHDTNKIAMNTAQKTAKRVLR